MNMQWNNLHLVSEEDEVTSSVVDESDELMHQSRPRQLRRRTASAMSLTFAAQQRINLPRSSARSHQSLSTLTTRSRSSQSSGSGSGTNLDRMLRRPLMSNSAGAGNRNETFGILTAPGPGSSYFPHNGRRGSGNNNNNPFLGNPKDNNNNPFLGNPKVSSILTGAPLHSILQKQPATQSSIGESGSVSSSGHQSMQQQQPQQQQQQQNAFPKTHPVSIKSIGPSQTCLSVASSSYSSTDELNNHAQSARPSSIIAPSPTPLIVAAPDHQDVPPQMGPSELYRLIATQGQVVEWDAILHRARSHPHEACFFDPNAGGHVYALHRLLRRTGGTSEDDYDECSSMASCTRRPPVSVVEAVIQACPRAVTRKQAVVDEDNILMSMNNEAMKDAHDDGMEWQAQINQGQGGGQAQLPNNAMGQGPQNNNAALQNNDNDDNEDEEDDQQDQQSDHDEVRYDYPLAIACECEQDGEVVRLLASYLSTTLPVYRSEVFRSLDYASLPNNVVRILLEEYAGCVLERGVNSEATEGDDDDCPLEQILFWWDDPDMMGMEEDIADYPNCNMKDDLCDLWEKLRMMLYAASMGSMSGYDSSKGSFQVLHHLLRILSEGGIQNVRFPNDFAHSVLLLAKFIKRENRGMFDERDESGSLPLHIAVMGEGFLCPRGENNDRNDDNQDVDEANGQAVNQEANGGAAAAVVQGNGVQGEGPPQAVLPGPAAAVPQQAGEQQQEPDQAEEDEDEDDGGGSATEDVDPSTNIPFCMAIVRLLLEQHPPSIRLRDSLSGSLPVHLALQHNPRADDAIKYFFELYPRSVTMPDGNGRLPLHLALLKESPVWVHVLGLNPSALEARDPVTGLLPFMLAAMEKNSDGKESSTNKHSEELGEHSDDLDSLSTTFRLLRMNPSLASGLGDVKPRPQSLIEQQIMVSYKPRVVKLEEENEELRRRVQELEAKLLSMQMMGSSINDDGSVETCTRKKRKSSPTRMLW